MFDTNDLETIAKETQVTKKKLNVTYNDLVHINRSMQTENPYSEFTETLYPKGFVFYDFEVFEYDWLVILIDPINKTKDIIANNREALRKYFDEHCNMIWVGYNNLHYDVPILKSILLGLNPKKVSDMIIVEGKREYEIDRRFNTIKMFSYDVMAHISNPPSLKAIEAFIGDNIEETSVPFDIDRPLTKKEMYETIHYCTHDVEETIKVFLIRINDFNASRDIIETFGLNEYYIEKTKGQLTAIVTDCERKDHDDEFDVTFVPVIQLDKYKYVMDWYKKILEQKSYIKPIPNTPENQYILSKGRQKKETDVSRVTFETNVCGIPHQFGWGGLHGAPDKPIHLKGKMFHNDVTSYYPSEMINFKFLSRNSKHPEKFKNVYDTRVALKKAGKSKEQAPYKIILNSQFGITKDKHSSAYDPVQANNICINGQLLLLDLLEHLESKMGERFQLIQSNTDGIIIMIDEDEKSERMMRHIVNEWCIRTGLGMGIDGLTEIFQKDVNSYLFRFDNGKIERKGGYVGELDETTYNMSIVNKALVEFMSNGTPVEKTINECNDMREFQIVYKVKGGFKYAWHNGEELSEKTFRVYASTDPKDTYLGRCREHGSTPNKFQNCPDNCFIYNKEINGIPMSIKVDKEWYIRLARKRLEDFDLITTSSKRLF